MSLADEGDGPGVIRHGREALRIFTVSGSREFQARAHWTIAWGHYVNQEWNESASASRASLELDPALTQVRMNLGLALLRAGEQEEARRAYEQAMAELVDTLALQESIEDLEKAVLEQPDLHSAEDILERLRAKQTALLEQSSRATGIARS